MNITNTLLKIIFLIALILNLSACGFKLRSENELPSSLHVLYLQTANPYGDFESILRSTLQSSGITLVKAPSEAPLTLSILSTNISNYTSNIGTTSQARVYTVVYSVSYVLKDSAGKLLIGPETLSTTSYLTLGANQLFDSNNQLSQQQQEMERDVLNQLYNRLSSRQVFDKLNHSTIQPSKSKQTKLAHEN